MRFQDSWLEEPALRDWLVKVSNDESRSYCRCCGIILRAHKADLVTHASTARHGKNAESASLAGISGALNVQIVTGDEQVMQGTIIGQSRTSPGFHDIGYQAYSRTPNSKRYRAEWQEIDELKDWLEPCQEDNTKAYCKMCAVQLRAHKHDLLLHGRSTKHKRCSQAATASAQQNSGSNPNVMSVEYETTVSHSDIVPSAIVDTIVSSVDDEPVMKKPRTMVEEVVTADDVMQNLQSDSDGGGNSGTVIMSEVRNGTNQEVNGSGDDEREMDMKHPAQISIIRVLDKPKNSMVFSPDTYRSGGAQLQRRRRGRINAADVIRAIDLNEFTGYEMLQILKRIVPKL